MPDKSAEKKLPPKDSADWTDLAALLDFENDAPPLYTPVFGKRLGELIDQSRRSPRTRSKRPKLPEHH